MSNLFVIFLVAIFIPALLVIGVQLREWFAVHRQHGPHGRWGGYQH